MSRRGTYTSDTHQVTTAALRSEQMCNYDLDELDQRWLNAANGERAQMGKINIYFIKIGCYIYQLLCLRFYKHNRPYNTFSQALLAYQT